MVGRGGCRKSGIDGKRRHRTGKQVSCRCGHVLGNARSRPSPGCHGCFQERGRCEKWPLHTFLRSSIPQLHKKLATRRDTSEGTHKKRRTRFCPHNMLNLSAEVFVGQDLSSAQGTELSLTLIPIAQYPRSPQVMVVPSKKNPPFHQDFYQVTAPSFR